MCTLMNLIIRSCLLFMSLILIISCGSDQVPNKDWKMYGGGNKKIQYSALNEIDTNNVSQLKIAWIYHTNDVEGNSQMEVNPIVVDGVLYGVSPKLKLFALDPVTGREKWTFNPFTDNSISGKKKKGINNCRGVSYYDGGGNDQRLFYTAGSSLYCINSGTGKLINTFGENGSIDLHNDLGREVNDLYITSTSPGIIYKDLIIVGSAVSEEAAAAPGHIRAFDVHTGKLRWIFHTIPYPNETGYDTWDDKEAYKHIGAANSWAGFSLDEEKGIVFAPTGSASDDWYGGKRLGDNLFANCVIAIDAVTGKRVWHFQTVHHDVWDRDLPAAPVLVTVTKDNKKVEAVVQVTKTGFLFLLDRATGKPLYPVEERPVPTNTELLGDRVSPTQPFPTFFEPLVRQKFTVADLNRDIPDSSYQDIKSKLDSLRSENLFAPPSKHPTIVFPGMTGGAEWGGPCYDPVTEILYINNNEIPRILTMIDAKVGETASGQTNLQAGKVIYTNTCAGCHGPERKGSGDFPTLIDIHKKYDLSSFMNLLSSGRRRMPAFNQLKESEKNALASYVLNIVPEQSKKFIAPKKDIDPYHVIPYISSASRPSKFETKEGYPAVSPPWGTLTALSLKTGKVEWKIPLGDYPELKAKGIHSGTENFGGPVVTAGGLVFIAATKDAKFRAFNKRTGKLLLEADLPTGGFATPAVFEIKGKQYIVIACGGGKLKTKPGDAYVAFTLPDK